MTIDTEAVFELFEITQEMEQLVIDYDLEEVDMSEEGLGSIAKDGYTYFTAFLHKMFALLKRMKHSMEKFVLGYSRTLKALIKTIPSGQSIPLPKGEALDLPVFDNELINIADGIYENVGQASRGKFRETYIPNLVFAADFQKVLKNTTMARLLRTVPYTTDKRLSQRLNPYANTKDAFLIPLHAANDVVDLLGVDITTGKSERIHYKLDKDIIDKKATLDLVSTDDYLEGAKVALHMLNGPYTYIYNLQNKMVD